MPTRDAHQADVVLQPQGLGDAQRGHRRAARHAMPALLQGVGDTHAPIMARTTPWSDNIALRRGRGRGREYCFHMRTQLPPDALARDERFHRITTAERFADLRPNDAAEQRRIDKSSDEVADRARRQMHGIFVGEIQALEGSGRTAFDYGTDETPFALKLDMARQCWDEARHVEISLLLGDHMGIEVGEFSESVTLFEAACHPDPVFRLAGVNRALEGLAIDVFTTMRDFAIEMNDPVLEFCEDWMLADEVTHVKMGSNWLRQLTSTDKDRQDKALDFQRTVDGLFNFRGARGETREASIQLARKFREMAGFDTAEIDEIARMAEEQRAQYLTSQRPGAY
jgi:uncharacterized ferritin-like protein (DUF455 family)